MGTSYHDAITEAKRKTWLLFFVFAILILLVGAAFGYVLFGDTLCGLIFVSFIGVVWALVTWYQGDKIILKMAGAVPATKG
ncbi:MAG TPA: hypothetical protein ENN76_00015, partial [Euryarchaeota archaeon]|nr:hypothetical protein [Euryarchaeota archaeon]